VVKVALDRFPARLVLVHAIVQGPDAPEQIVRAQATPATGRRRSGERGSRAQASARELRRLQQHVVGVGQRALEHAARAHAHRQVLHAVSE
jgi:exonuclease VII large subunit